MLTLSTPVSFGKQDRFKAYQFDNKRFLSEWNAVYGKESSISRIENTIFVEDTTQIDNFGLPLIVFQDLCISINNLDQVIDIVRKRFPDAFDVQEKYNAVFYSPTGE